MRISDWSSDVCPSDLGVGALWLREGLELPPLIYGGGQEQGMRSGTLSPALCVGLGVAAKLMRDRAESDAAHVDALWSRAVELFANWRINGSVMNRYHGNLNIRREGLDAARLMSECRDIAFSLGSACASGSGPASARKSVESGKSVSVRVELGVRRVLTKKKQK